MNPPRRNLDTDGDIIMYDYHQSSDSSSKVPSNQPAQSTASTGRTWSTAYMVPSSDNIPSMNQVGSSPEPPSLLLRRGQFPTFLNEHSLNPRADLFRPSQPPLNHPYHDQGGRFHRTIPLELPFIQHPPEHFINNRRQSIRQPEQTMSSRQLPRLDRNLPPLSSVIQSRSNLPHDTLVPNLQAHVAAHFASRTNSVHEAQAAARLLEQFSPLTRRTPLTTPPIRNGLSSLPPLPNIWNNSIGQLPHEPHPPGGHHTDDHWPGTHLNTLSDRLIAVPVSRKTLKRPERKIKTTPCTACMEQFENSALVPAPCTCKYCKDCLNDLFRSGCTSILNFPPSCHGKALRINVFGELLNPDVLSRYKQVEQEFSSQKPLYCALPTCSEFIQEKDIVGGGNYGICGTCSNCTCTLCKMLLGAHKFDGARVCPAEPKSLIALRELGHQEEWRQCPSCSNMVEKIDGCDHMECPCGVEFCYRCGSFYNEWDECACAGDTNSDEEHEEEDDEQTMWPDHRRMMDAFGRPRCTHGDIDLVDGDMCHGCLTQRGHQNLDIRFLRCMRCSIELCTGCYGSIVTGTTINQ